MPKNKEEHDVIMEIRIRNPSGTVVGSPYPDWMLLGYHDFYVENQFMTEDGKVFFFNFQLWVINYYNILVLNIIIKKNARVND